MLFYFFLCPPWICTTTTSGSLNKRRLIVCVPSPLLTMIVCSSSVVISPEYFGNGNACGVIHPRQPGSARSLRADVPTGQDLPPILYIPKNRPDYAPLIYGNILPTPYRLSSHIFPTHIHMPELLIRFHRKFQSGQHDPKSVLCKFRGIISRKRTSASRSFF